ncbi:hypothetical protein HF086_017456 [Spodoptera exigua]|uniref:Uncharacterized protein n=1 Tax=Spodoptera exigua TaxID=7107 RepID=A0A922S9G0_SPOEX|nr:hypothetical protein HF086_017456 [Spodoptera exigua]
MFRSSVSPSPSPEVRTIVLKNSRQCYDTAAIIVDGDAGIGVCSLHLRSIRLINLRGVVDSQDKKAHSSFSNITNLFHIFDIPLVPDLVHLFSISCCSTFYYSRSAFRRSENCNLCYEKECIPLEQSRCDYYKEVDSWLPKDDDEPGTADNQELKREVDDLMFDLVDKGVSNDMECIPYVSRYTNCNKDNVCLGCKSCACDSNGRWQCTTVASCHTRPAPLNIDHRVLVLVMGNLIEKSSPFTETFSTTAATASKTSNTDTDSLEFDEVLRSIAVDTKSYNRRKPLDYKLNNESFSIDYIIFDQDNITSDKANGDNLAYMMNLMQEDDVVTESSDSGATKIVIDLLPAAERLGAKSNTSEDYVAFNKDTETNVLENMNDVVDYNAINIVKRDVTEQNKTTASSTVPMLTILVNTTNNTKDNYTGESLAINFKESVLVPLTKVIVDKIKEVENLKNIKENLAKFVNSDVAIPEDIKNNTGNSYFSIYNLVMDPGYGVGLRRSNSEGNDNHTLKLKNDIFEVIRDIITIKRRKGTDVPDDLNYLLHSLKRYVYKNRWEAKPKKIKMKKMKNFRRQMDQNDGRCSYISFQDCLIKILEEIDKDSPKSNALSPLSPTSRKIMKRIINSFYFDEHGVEGLRVHDPSYNLTNDLNMIGTKWRDISANLISSTPFANLFRMKILHFVLTSDISKMNDVLGLIEFSHSRRMLPSLDKVSDNVIDKINVGLTAIHNKIQIIMRYYSQKPNSPDTTNALVETEAATTKIKDKTDSKKKKSRSFIKHIRSLLETSKKDIAELLHRKVPKSDIVKQLAKKKLDEITEKRYTEYEEAMKKWQKNLEVSSRKKRFVLDKFTARIKNIIPGYLRHKVNPKIKENKKSSTANSTRLADDGRRKAWL